MNTQGKSFFDLNPLNERLMDAMEVLINQQKAKEKAIFDYFKAVVPEGHILILPERFHPSIGDFSERIIFSPYVKNDKGYIVDKSKMDITLNPDRKLLEEE